jgi:hypothetical protein
LPLDTAPALAKIGVSIGEPPYRVNVIGQYANGNVFKWILLAYCSPCMTEPINFVNQQ